MGQSSLPPGRVLGPPAGDLDPILQAAVAIAAEAADLALVHHHRGVAKQLKGERNPVTVADLEVEALIRARLAEAFPDDVVVGEEQGGTGVAGRHRWYVDPIDGTVNFLKRSDWWGVSLGRCDPDDALEVGVVALPARRELFSAARGRGAARNGVPLHVNGAVELSDAVVAWSHGPRGSAQWGGQEAVLAGLGRLGGSVLGLRVTGSCSADLCAVATGVVDAFWASGMAPWDSAGGLLVAAEAGAIATDPAGTPSTAPLSAFLVAAPGVHDDLRAVITGRPEGRAPRAQGRAPAG